MEGLTVCCFGEEFRNLYRIELSLSLLAREILRYNKENVDFLFEYRSYFDLVAARVVRKEVMRTGAHSRLIGVLPYEIPYLLENPAVYQKYFDELDYCILAAQTTEDRMDRCIRKYMIIQSQTVLAYSPHRSGPIQESVEYAKENEKDVLYI